MTRPRIYPTRPVAPNPAAIADLYARRVVLPGTALVGRKEIKK